MASTANSSDDIVVPTTTDKMIEISGDDAENGQNVSLDCKVDHSGNDNVPSADLPLLPDGDDNQNLTYSKEYEAVLQIKQVSSKCMGCSAEQQFNSRTA
jgi:hypothetical protein